VAGVHRARILAKYLPQHGWEPVVFCVDERYHSETLDPELAELVPPATRIVKTAAWPTRLARRFGVGDLGIRGFWSLRSAIDRFLAAEGGDVVFITILPGFPMRLGPYFKRRYGVPFVLDYQDPWRLSHAVAPPLSKAWLAYRLADWIEPRVISATSHITSVSDGTNDLIRRNYPELPATRFSAIPIGGDADDFRYLRARPRPCPWIETTPGRVNLCYVGNVWPGAEAALRALLRACRLLETRAPDVYATLRLTFVGTSNQPGRVDVHKVLPIAVECGLADKVVEVPGRVPYLDALNTLLRADVVLMLGSNKPHYTASKLYPSLLSGRPMLGIFHAHSSVCRIAESAGGVMLVTFDETTTVASKTEEIAMALLSMVRDPARVPPVDQEVLRPYLGEEIARRFAAVFDSIV
jgi:hypothetical protein